MAIWVFKDGNREGPYEEADLRELIYEGTYRDADMAVSDDDPVQRTLGEILGHGVPAEASSPGAAPPPLPPAETGSDPAAALEPPALPPAIPPPPPPAAPPIPMPVSVVDFQMPFGSMVLFMIKWALAAIPAMLILAAILGIFWTAIFTTAAGVLSALAHH